MNPKKHFFTKLIQEGWIINCSVTNKTFRPKILDETIGRCPYCKMYVKEELKRNRFKSFEPKTLQQTLT